MEYMKVAAYYKGKRFKKKMIPSHMKKMHKRVEDCLIKYNVTVVKESTNLDGILWISDDEEKVPSIRSPHAETTFGRLSLQRGTRSTPTYLDAT